MQKHVNLADLVKSFPTSIFLQNLASIQKRTSPRKFAHLAEKSENGSISNFSTKAQPDANREREAEERADGEQCGAGCARRGGRVGLQGLLTSLPGWVAAGDRFLGAC